jgi:hypothetical protein
MDGLLRHKPGGLRERILHNLHRTPGCCKNNRTSPEHTGMLLVLATSRSLEFESGVGGNEVGEGSEDGAATNLPAQV